MAKPVHIDVTRGTTLVSGKYFSTNEPVPSNISYTELQAGIALGTYTLKSLANKEYKGQVRDRANAAIQAELVFVVEDDQMQFMVPNLITATWSNKTNTFFYDVHETDTVTGIVRVAAEGTIGVIPSITLD